MNNTQIHLSNKGAMFRNVPLQLLSSLAFHKSFCVALAKSEKVGQAITHSTFEAHGTGVHRKSTTTIFRLFLISDHQLGVLEKLSGSLQVAFVRLILLCLFYYVFKLLGQLYRDH